MKISHFPAKINTASQRRHITCLYGNECNVLAEILFDRYDQFVTHQMRTHLTSKLNASELETLYGDRLRSRLRQMCNVLIFPATAPDRRR